MIKVFLFISIFSLSIFAQIANSFQNDDDSFITKSEYGKMLYNNPRGIGCNSCHGKDARGKKIVKFSHVYQKKKYNCELSIPSIVNVKYKDFSKKINAKRNGKKKFLKHQVCEKLIYYSNVMPTYFLVEEEIEAIYQYVQTLKNSKN